MEAADSGALAAEPAGDVHEAGVVRGSTDFGAGSENAAEFVGQHGGGDLDVFDSEGSAEAAALGGLGQVDQRETADFFEQAFRLVA